ncbi:MAG: aldo/keto reductase family protein [Myxococcota bacterium]|jgi:voltage-dependent potassium channel beta subunit|nr:aldo/keto reductase family protein [Myxococcota bacterium]MEC9440307.1 aldo/keto reductase family protein [Myxococcota bacterium]
MKYRQVGQSGLRVSEVSIGGWLTFGKSVADETAHDILRVAIDEGINFIDVADIYAKGESERVVGELIRDYRRDDLVISSKVFWPMSEGINDRGLSRKHIMESVEGSLRRLGTDYLDIYFCHRWDEHVPLDETLRAMEDLIRQGKVLYWGTSMWSGDQLELAHDRAEHWRAYAPTVEQPRYNLIHREIEADVLPRAKKLGMGLVVWSPLAQGLLTGKYNDGVPEGSRGADSSWLENDLNDKNLERIREFCDLAKELSLSPAQLALAWCLTRPEVSSVITGASRTRQVRDNVKAAQVELEAEVRQKLDDLFSVKG